MSMKALTCSVYFVMFNRMLCMVPFVEFIVSAKSAIACWGAGLQTFNLECDVTDGPISILSSTTSVSTCNFVDGCCVNSGDCTVTSPDNAMTDLYTECEGEYTCSVLMTPIYPLPGCGGIDASNYQVVYYTCGDPTTTVSRG